MVTTALNVPGPAAARRLAQLGAQVTKVEPPDGDPLAAFAPDWYAELSSGQRVLRLDLRDPEGLASLDAMLPSTDVLLTSQRPGALERLGLGPQRLRDRYPRLLHVALIGDLGAAAEIAGHDLNYLAAAGLLEPDSLPRSLWVDLAGAERAAAAVLELILAREVRGAILRAEVSLAEVARRFAEPDRYGLTSPGGLLGGGSPFYGVYPARTGWVAVAALEPRFRARLAALVGGAAITREALAAAFLTRDADEWETLGRLHDVPVNVVR